MTDPQGSPPVSPTTNVDTNEPKFYARPRWWRGKPPMTERRTHAIREKRAWEKSARNPASYASGTELALLKPYLFDVELVLAAFPGARLGVRHLHVIGLIAAAVFGQKRLGAICSHHVLGQALGLQARRTGTIVRELVEWGVLVTWPTFRPFGAITSRRANGYELSVPLYAALSGDRAHAKPGNAISTSGLPGIPEISPSPSELDPKLSGDCLAAPGESKVSASPTKICRTVVPDGTTDASQPVARQGATRDVVGRLWEPEVADRVTSVGEYLELLTRLQAGGAS